MDSTGIKWPTLGSQGLALKQQRIQRAGPSLSATYALLLGGLAAIIVVATVLLWPQIVGAVWPL